MKNGNRYEKRRWFSGKISRCHRDAPGSIPGRRIAFFNFYIFVIFCYPIYLFFMSVLYLFISFFNYDYENFKTIFRFRIAEIIHLKIIFTPLTKTQNENVGLFLKFYSFDKYPK